MAGALSRRQGEEVIAFGSVSVPSEPAIYASSVPTVSVSDIPTAFEAPYALYLSLLQPSCLVLN